MCWLPPFFFFSQGCYYGYFTKSLSLSVTQTVPKKNCNNNFKSFSKYFEIIGITSTHAVMDNCRRDIKIVHSDITTPANLTVPKYYHFHTKCMLFISSTTKYNIFSTNTVTFSSFQFLVGWGKSVAHLLYCYRMLIISLMQRFLFRIESIGVLTVLEYIIMTAIQASPAVAKVSFLVRVRKRKENLISQLCLFIR